LGAVGAANGAVVDALSSDSNLVLHAMADIYADRIDAGLKAVRDAIQGEMRINVPPERRFVGWMHLKRSSRAAWIWCC